MEEQNLTPQQVADLEERERREKAYQATQDRIENSNCLLYTSPSPRD